MSEDARRSERIKSFLRAQIIFNNRLSTVDCIVKNISLHGARVALDEAMTIPNQFELHIPQKGKTYRARMAWRDSGAIGVEFVDEPSAAITVPSTSLSDGTPEGRVRELEIMNAQLKARIRELSKRLEDLGQDPNLAA